MNPEPVATYRLQLHCGFGFDQAAEVVPYLADLGISHLYASPYLQAAAGSTHGYDIVDPSRVNEELGGPEAHARMCAALRGAGLGQMIDVVPNHMAIAGRQNPWWWDVLENGPSSRYANYFDVDWVASEDRWPNKVLLPVLGNHYGRILEDGQLTIFHKAGVFTIHYEDHVFPVDPSSLAELLNRAAAACGSEVLAFLAQCHARLPRPVAAEHQAVTNLHRDKKVLSHLRARLCREEPEIDAAINAEIDRLNRDPDALDRLIDNQNYRLSFWRTASRDLGYRRFFDIKDLAGLRIEDIEVFRATHALPIAWVKEGLVQGLRIDHPDGLRDPTNYFSRLRDACPDTWIVAEKILGPEEKLPLNWPISGTTGYDFLNRVSGLFVDPTGEDALTRMYEDFIDSKINVYSVVHECKRLVLTELLASEINRLTSLFVNICEQHRRHRDYTREELREALRETAVFFPVYRSYVSTSGNTFSPQDELFVNEAIAGAMAERPDLDPELFRFLKNLLLLHTSGSLEGELAMRFQQLTGSAMAKGVEDTAFYRFHRLVALNEVGADPGIFGIHLGRFHEDCAVAQTERPLALLASTTHDTKRSEDVRARLAVLSEIPGRWAAAVQRWSERNERHRCGDVPDRNTEYLFYQTLIGAWPINVERIMAFMEKAVREAKVQTSWTMQNETYERGVQNFIKAALEDEVFRADLEAFAVELVPYGRINSLAQTLVKLTAPGVPDIYQGTELWDLSLVDPDNRRPVDFIQRRRLLREVAQLAPSEIMARMDEGLPKLWIIRQALNLRRKHHEAFGRDGQYRALYAQGKKADHVVAFIRGEAVVSLAPRLVVTLGNVWLDTVLELPEGVWHNLLTHEHVAGGVLRLADALKSFPVGLFVKKE